MFVFMLLVITGLSGVGEADKKIQLLHTILPYRQLMTPKWLHTYSTISGSHNVQSKYLEILPTSGVGWQHGLQQQLVPPGVMSSSDSVTVTITVAMDTALADSGDHDPSFGVSDGTSFNGFSLYDKENYDGISPCRHIEGDRGNKALENSQQDNGPTTSSQRYSNKATMQIRPTEQWGSCDTGHDEGYTNIVTYHRQLDLTKGLYLEIYRHDAGETYRINYLMVEVDID